MNPLSSNSNQEQHLIQTIKNFGYSSLGKLINKLRLSYLPKDSLPLSQERMPFRNLTDESIVEILQVALLFPEKKGRLSSIIYEKLGIANYHSKNFLVIEAHIDITDVDKFLLNKLVELGFEPDNAFINSPACYKKGFTLGFTLSNHNREVYRVIRKLVEDRSVLAAQIIQNTSNINGFIEVEIYGSGLIKRYYPFKPISKASLKQFPFGNYDCVNLPTTEVEAEQKGIALDVCKVIDVHLKLPTAFRKKSFPNAESENILKLRRKIQDFGLHELITEAGNAIYTGQFLKTAQAKALFKALDLYATNYGGILELVMEPCVYFWRKETIKGNKRVLAEVPRVLIPNNISGLLSNL